VSYKNFNFLTILKLGEARLGKAGRGLAGQGKARQGRAGRGKVRQGMAGDLPFTKKT